MRKLLAVAVITFTVFSSGCSQDSNKPSGQFDPATASIVPSAANPYEAAIIKEGVAELKSKVEELETKVFSLEFSKDEYKTTWFDPAGDRHYQRVDANIGYFLVVLENVEPYLDGQKVTLLIGNPNNVTFSGFEIKASWSARQPAIKLGTEEFRKAWKAYVASQKEKEVKLTDTLHPGTWNNVRFTIAPAKAEEFGSLRIGITTNQVRLAGGR